MMRLGAGHGHCNRRVHAERRAFTYEHCDFLVVSVASRHYTCVVSGLVSVLVCLSFQQVCVFVVIVLGFPFVFWDGCVELGFRRRDAVGGIFLSLAHQLRCGLAGFQLLPGPLEETAPFRMRFFNAISGDVLFVVCGPVPSNAHQAGT